MIDLPGEYSNEAQGQMSAKEATSLQIGSTTVGQNIQNRIARHKEAIAKLEAVYATLQTGTLLDVNMNDLQQAMRW